MNRPSAGSAPTLLLGQEGALSRRAPATPAGAEAQPAPRSPIPAVSPGALGPSPARPARLQGCSFTPATTRAHRGIRTLLTTPCSYKQEQQRIQHSFLRDGSGGESIMRNKNTRQ